MPPATARPRRRPAPAPWPAAPGRRPGRSRRGLRAVALVLLAGLLASPALTAQARPADPGPAVPVPDPGPAGLIVTPAGLVPDPAAHPRPARSARPAQAKAAPPGDLASLRAEATRLRARLDDQHRRLEVLAEDLEEAYARGVELLADASRLDRRRRAAERELATAQAALDERARSTYIAGPGWFVAGLVGADDPADALARLPLQRAVLEADLALVDRVARARTGLDDARSRLAARLVDQARGAEQLDAKRAKAERLAADIRRELHGMDRRVAALIDRDRRREEATQRAAFASYLAAARAAGTAPARGRASAAARRAVAVALVQLGSPYVWGADGPGSFDCSGLTSFAYAAAGVTLPRVSRAQFAAYAGRRVDPLHLLPGDLVFFADAPADPGTIHHVGLYVGNGLMVEAPHTGAVVRTAPIWRPSYAGAVRPAP
jgi:cell wall-associated NlpC family hydrolase